MAGWIRLSRNIFECWLWDEKPFSKAQAWIDLLLMANYETKKVVLGNELIEVERGSFITSEVKLSERWGWSRTKTRSYLYLLESDNMIIKKSDSKKTVITIVKYGIYQDIETAEEQQKNSKKTAKKQQKNTTNNINNINNINNLKEGGAFHPPTVEEVKAYCQERQNSIDPETFVDFYTAKGWKVGKDPMKDWKASVRTWEKRDNKQPEKKTKAHNFTERNYTDEDFKKLEGFARN